MIITYHGLGLVKAQVADRVVAFNPIGKTDEAKAVRFGANLVLISLNDSRYNGAEQMTFGDKTPLVIDGPGEYEGEGVFVHGVPSVGPEGKINTIYSVLFEDIRLVHLGALAEAELSDEAVEKIGEVDILFLPIGPARLEPKAAAKLALNLGAKIVTPIDYADEPGRLSAFLKEMGNGSAETLEKLTIKKKDLISETVKVIVLKN